MSILNMDLLSIILALAHIRLSAIVKTPQRVQTSGPTLDDGLIGLHFHPPGTPLHPGKAKVLPNQGLRALGASLRGRELDLATLATLVQAWRSCRATSAPSTPFVHVPQWGNPKPATLGSHLQIGIYQYKPTQTNREY